MEEYVIPAAGIRHWNHVGLAVIIMNGNMRDETCVENLLEYRDVCHGLV